MQEVQLLICSFFWLGTFLHVEGETCWPYLYCLYLIYKVPQLLQNDEILKIMVDSCSLSVVYRLVIATK